MVDFKLDVPGYSLGGQSLGSLCMDRPEEFFTGVVEHVEHCPGAKKVYWALRETINGPLD